ncbi:hypothetical protein F5050DRAFT_1032428 [Lentinula boryana]|uniref:Uncharacterized protein n=1 Tax=Lentinula boryana TaxID=40481 RepID=A0ABQ8Q004_9AGAR|nr:hypothetical protein F5050DRAFT_1032428 [Lentinula boryana]
MYLLSSPAHLFSMVLLSIVLGAMTMAVPLTVRDTDIGKWQWLSKRQVKYPKPIPVGLVRRKDASDASPAKVGTSLDSQEHWSLSITRRHSFHAVQEDGQWRVKEIISKKQVPLGLVLGTIEVDPNYSGSYYLKRMANLYSKITTITDDSNQFKALDHLIEFLTTTTFQGLTYKPREGDTDTWRKIFLAMTDYKKYLEEFPNVNERYTNRQYELEQLKEKQRIEDEEKEKQRIEDEQEKEKQRIEDEGKQRQRIKGQMDINSVLG